MTGEKPIGGDPCPNCGAELDWDMDPESGDWWIVHPDPPCGWVGLRQSFDSRIDSRGRK